VAEAVSQIVLPITLALIMLVMGMGLAKSDFVNLARHPKASLFGLAAQLLLLPVLAITVANLFGLSAMASAGLVLLSLCPGGATSNAFSLFARGDVALSVSLTAITSLIVPFSLPMAFALYLSITQTTATTFSLPLLLIIKQLVIVTLLPVIIGMVLRHYWTAHVEKSLPVLRKLAGVIMLSVIVLLMATNTSVLTQSLSNIGGAALSLCIISMSLAYWVSKKLAFAGKVRRTLAIEVGVQNAGTAMMVAYSVLNLPELAVVPLTYGLLMNIPALIFVGWANSRSQTLSTKPL